MLKKCVLQIGHFRISRILTNSSFRLGHHQNKKNPSFHLAHYQNKNPAFPLYPSMVGTCTTLYYDSTTSTEFVHFYFYQYYVLSQ